MSRVAVYDRYWRTLGGGEQFAGGIAEVLAERHDVDVLGPDQPDRAALLERLGVDLSGCRFRPITDEQSVSDASRDYDLLINCTYLSFAPCRAAHGLYVAHFPAPPDPAAAARRRRRSAVARVLKAAPHDWLPERAQRVRDDWSGDALGPLAGLDSYTTVVANSAYTQLWLQRLWNVRAEVLWPPVRLPAATGRDPASRDPYVLSIGRFIDPKLGHCKKQGELAAAFALLERNAAANDWSLHLVGGCEADNRAYLQSVRRRAEGHRVQFHINASGRERDELLASSSIYWHGAGLDEDPDLHPDRYEHFGISIVEAMSHGVVPIVLGSAGPAEIVRDGVDGIHVSSAAEFAAATSALIADSQRRIRLAHAAMERAQTFGFPAFRARLLNTISALVEPAVVTDLP